MRTVFSLILAACLVAPVHAANTNADADVAAIRHVVQQFQTAIIAHDGKTLGSLFLPEGGAWRSALDDATYAAAKARNPAAPRTMPSTWQDFVGFVQRSTKPIEERFHDVRIDTNGTVASVWFDFEFVEDGKVTNRGSETWQLVRMDDGWKINAMLYSIGH